MKRKKIKIFKKQNKFCIVKKIQFELSLCDASFKITIHNYACLFFSFLEKDKNYTNNFIVNFTQIINTLQKRT